MVDEELGVGQLMSLEDKNTAFFSFNDYLFNFSATNNEDVTKVFWAFFFSSFSLELEKINEAECEVCSNCCT